MYSVSEIFILILLLWIVFSLAFSLYFIDELMGYGERRFPHQIYKEWLENKNMFGKAYTTICIYVFV